MSYRTWDNNLVNKAWMIAASYHNGQYFKSSKRNIPYLIHLNMVASLVMNTVASEVENVDDPTLAVVSAILHDTIEDTDLTYSDIADSFDEGIAEAVLALTKDSTISDKEDQLLDSIYRIKQQPREVWIVKLADRAINLQSSPPNWNVFKKYKYAKQGQHILKELGRASPYLSEVLFSAIKHYT